MDRFPVAKLALQSPSEKHDPVAPAAPEPSRNWPVLLTLLHLALAGLALARWGDREPRSGDLRFAYLALILFVPAGSILYLFQCSAPAESQPPPMPGR